MNHYRFEFDVTLIKQKHNEDPEEIVYFNSLPDMRKSFPNFSVENIVVYWYTNFWSLNYQPFEVENIVFSHDKNLNKYVVEYDVDKNECDEEYDNYQNYNIFVAKMLVDPDYEGNNPLKLDGDVYLVMGEADITI